MNIYDKYIEDYTKKGLLKEVYNDGVLSITSINGKMYGVHDYRTDSISPTSFGFGNVGHIARICDNPDLYYEFIECGLMDLYDIQNLDKFLSDVGSLDLSKTIVKQMDPVKEAEIFGKVRISYEGSKIPMGKKGG